jgi:glycine cleavage system aminomethyltransferase T
MEAAGFTPLNVSHVENSDGTRHNEAALDSDAMVAIDVTGPEFEALAQGCALVDRSERGKLALTGSQAAEFLNGQVTNDVEALAPARASTPRS